MSLSVTDTLATKLGNTGIADGDSDPDPSTTLTWILNTSDTNFGDGNDPISGDVLLVWVVLELVTLLNKLSNNELPNDKIDIITEPPSNPSVAMLIVELELGKVIGGVNAV